MVTFNPNIFFERKDVRVCFFNVYLYSMKNFEHIIKKNRFEYEFLEILDAGVVLIGSEVKNVRNREFTLQDGYCYFVSGELFIKNFVINKSDAPNREKKLLLKRQQLKKLERDLIKGLTIVPYRIFQTDKGRIKMSVALARRNKNYEKKQKLKEKDLDREKNFLD